MLNPNIDFLDKDTLTFVRGLFITLRDYVERIEGTERTPYEKAHEIAEEYLANNPDLTFKDEEK